MEIEKPSIMYVSIIYRKIAYPLARIFSKTPITANHVTILGLLFAIAGSYSLSFGTYFSTILGILLLQVHIILDYTDGTLARMKGPLNLFGDFLEFIVDRIVFILILFGLGWGLYASSNNPTVWFLCFLVISVEFLYETIYFGIKYRFMERDKAKETIKNNKIMKVFNYYPHNVYLLMLVFALLDKMFFCLIFISIYGFLFYIATIVYLGMKLRLKAKNIT